MQKIQSNSDIIKQIPMLLEKILTKIVNSELKLFYNEHIVNKWLGTLNFEIISYDAYKLIVQNKASKEIYSKYVSIEEVFSKVVCDVKIIVKRFALNYVGLTHIPGCINLDKKYYAYCANLHTGIPIGTDIPYTRLYN